MQSPTERSWASVAMFLSLCMLLGTQTLLAQTPKIASWSPYHGTPGTVVTIAGSNLTATTGVLFNGVPGINLSIVSSWSLKIAVPAGAITGPVTITSAAGSYTAGSNFTVDSVAPLPPPPPPQAPTPTIASWTPSHGVVGTQVSIEGSNLGTVSAVYFNGVAGTNLASVSDWALKITVPPGATTGPVKVTNAGGTYTASGVFTVDPPPPTIASWSPYHAPVGSVVTIAGANLQTTSSVYFNGVMAITITVNSDWSVSAVIPPGATTGPVSIHTGGGAYTAGSNFTVDAPAGSGSSGSGGGTGSGGSAPSPSGFVNPPPIDPPVGAMIGHPRIFVRQSDLPRLQNWAVPSNPVWNDLLSLAESSKASMDSGALNVDNGDGYSGFNPIESFAELFAFMSLIHPDPAAQADYASRAHDIMMRIINQAALGQAAGQPYRDPNFAIANRASWYGESFAVVLDWDYANFTAQEKATIRQVFLRWIQENLLATTAGGDHPQPVGVVNDPSIASSAHDVRWSTNNYFSNHARHIGLLSMAMDAADDIPSVATDPPAGTLRRFVGNAIGAWLYVQNQYENTYGAGGIEPEGTSYGELSQRAWAFLLLAMHTTGTDNPQVYGPQAADITNSYWSQAVTDNYLNMLSPAQTVQQNWIGPAYLPYSFSDNANYVTADNVRVFGPLAMYAMNTGNTAMYGKLRWMIDNLPPGGPNYRHTRIIDAWSYTGSLSSPIFYFLATDPNAAAGTDPRPAEQPDYFAPGTGVLLSRTGWTPGDAWFTYKLTWNAIDHQHGDGNAIGFYRGGEWLTMPASGYGRNIGSSDYQNTVAIQNPGNTNDPFWMPNMTRGSQWEYGPGGDPSPVTHSSNPSYTYAQGDATNLYNNPDISAVDVKHASRSVLWLKPDAIVVYDRATTGVAGHFKRFHLNTPAQAAVNGTSATVATPGGQFLFMDALLPANATLTSIPRENLPSEPAAGDPVPFRLWSEDLSMPADVRFLNVLQGSSTAGSRQPVSLIQSSSGTAFDGAAVGGIAVLFRQNITTSFSSVTFNVPATTTTTYITGLTPGASYSVVKSLNANSSQYTVTPGGALIADAGGVLAF